MQTQLLLQQILIPHISFSLLTWHACYSPKQFILKNIQKVDYIPYFILIA